MFSRFWVLAIITLMSSAPPIGLALANEVKVIEAGVKGSAGRFRFSVTLLHADNGWDHYADRWQVLSPEGDVLATRVLAHPHDSEQPFTRGLSGVTVPEGITWVNIRAHDKVHGDGPVMLKVDLPGR